MKIIKIDVINNYFEFDYKELLEIYNLREEILWVDSFTDKQMLHVPFEYNTNMIYNTTINNISKCSFQFTETCNILSKFELKILKRFHYNWFNNLKDYFNTKEFKELILKINKHTTNKMIFNDFQVNPKYYNKIVIYETNRIIQGFYNKELHTNFYLNGEVVLDLQEDLKLFWNEVLKILNQKKDLEIVILTNNLQNE